MRLSQSLFTTLREDPAEAEVRSHKLLSRAGFIRRAAGGVYTYMPMALRVMRKISQIVREEMDRQGGQELQLPIMQPAELWQESGRWGQYGAEMFRLRDRHGRDFCLGPTHEEIVTSLLKGEVRSYRQLPVLVYQIAPKYRDEIRPRFGLMRGREFTMKDLYSFDADDAGLAVSYAKMHEAYCRVFKRCGLAFRPVEADSGLIGGNSSHEFMVMADSGEADVAVCPGCDYAANLEKAECIVDIESLMATARAAEAAEAADAARAADTTNTAERNVASPEPEVAPQVPPSGPRPVTTPGAHTVAEVAALLGCDATRVLKTLLFTDGKRTFAALVRGDHAVNALKLAQAIGVPEVELAPDWLVEQTTSAPVGFAGPIGLLGGVSGHVMVVADNAVLALENVVVGANKADTHLVGVTPGVDFQIDLAADIRMAVSGDLCPRCGEGRLSVSRGIEVGHIFKLGTKYSKALGATFLDAASQEQLLVMGCYGIGISRTMAAAVEQLADDDGMIWPMAISPYHVIVVPVSVSDPEQAAAAESVYAALTEAGVEAVLDDRDERAGVKFKDADLVGFPIRVTLGAKALAQGCAEVKLRSSREPALVELAQVVDHVRDLVRARD